MKLSGRISQSRLIRRDTSPKPPLVISIVGNNYTDFDKGIIEVIEDENGRAY